MTVCLCRVGGEVGEEGRERERERPSGRRCFKEDNRAAKEVGCAVTRGR